MINSLQPETIFDPEPAAEQVPLPIYYRPLSDNELCGAVFCFS
jgi:hypothetical protein